MCKLRDDTMSQAGELPDFRTAVEIEWSKGKTMESKDEGSAAVRGNVRSGCPCEPLGLDGAVCPDPKTGLPLCASADCYSTKPGAAVRGEAVAGVPDIYRANYWFNCLDQCATMLGLDDDEGIPSGVVNAVRKLTSARAADAPSEQSRADLEAIERAMQHMGDALNAVDLADEDDEEVTAAGFSAIARLLKSRAADAPSEPTSPFDNDEWEHEVNNWMGEYRIEIRATAYRKLVDIGNKFAAKFVKSRAADALDSQPTDQSSGAGS